jgi:YhcH/YjgK/YiaL family protein
MILDNLENAHLYRSLNPGFAEAFEFLARPDLKDLPAGTCPIDGKRVYAMIAKGAGRRRDEGRLEIHERYIDIQVVLSGTDEMGWKPRSACRVAAGAYDAAKDMQLFTDPPEAWVAVQPGRFAIFFPADAHLPMVSPGELHKVVIKVAVNPE